MSVESIDLHEAALPQGIDGDQPDLIPYPSGMKASAYVERVAARFDSVLPGLSAILRDGVRAFGGGNTRLEDNGLEFLDDADLSAIVDHDRCTLVTIARQEQTQGSSILRIDNRLFQHPRHPEMSHAVLILHELVYRQARLNGQTDSRNSRLLLGAMLTQGDGRTVWQMLQLASDLGFLKLDVAETALEQFRARLGLQALAQAWDAYATYSQGDAAQRLSKELHYAMPIVGGWGSNDVLDGTSPLLTVGGMSADPTLQRLQGDYRDFMDARGEVVFSDASHFAETVLEPQVRRQFPEIPGADAEKLEISAENSPYFLRALARAFFILPSASTRSSSFGALGLLANPKGFTNHEASGKLLLPPVEWKLNFILIGQTEAPDVLDLDLPHDPTGVWPTMKVVDLQRLGRFLMSYSPFLHPEQDFGYALPVVK